VVRANHRADLASASGHADFFRGRFGVKTSTKMMGVIPDAFDFGLHHENDFSSGCMNVRPCTLMTATGVCRQAEQGGPLPCVPGG